MLARKDEAVQEYSIVMRQIQKQKIKGTDFFQNAGNKELYDKFDSVITQGIEDFDVISERREDLAEMVKKIAKSKNFVIHL